MNEEQIDEIYEQAEKGDLNSNMMIIESVGNDDAVNKAFIHLVNLARKDEREDITHYKYNPCAERICKNARNEAVIKVREAVDAYMKCEPMKINYSARLGVKSLFRDLWRNFIRRVNLRR